MFNPYRFPIQNIIGLNNALGDKLNTSEVAEEFDSTTSYAVGAYCLYQGVLYKFTSAHSGAWDAADVIAVSVMGEIAGGGASPYTSNPEMDGIASPGSSPEYARGNHVHPSDTRKLDKIITKDWVNKSWNINGLYGEFVWADGENIYYSTTNGGGVYKVFNKNTGEWENKTWSGLTSFSGNNIWTDGEDTYYSDGSATYILVTGGDSSTTGVWQLKSSSGAWGIIQGHYIWKDLDGNVYYSRSDGITNYQYKYNEQNDSWETVPWNVELDYGSDIWTDNENIYYSHYSTQYVLDESTGTWENKTWNGMSSFTGSYIWTDGEDIYFSNVNGDGQKVLNISTSTWESKTWSLNPDFGDEIWTDNENIYYSDETNGQYKLAIYDTINESLKVNSDIKATGEVEDGYGNTISGVKSYVDTQISTAITQVLNTYF